jgi:DNA-binding MarR family transcriptional regulator
MTPIQTPSVGSSSNSSFGSPSMARPIASILRSPPERVPAGWSRRWPSFGKMVSTWSTASAFLLASEPTARLSRTDKRANTECEALAVAKTNSPITEHLAYLLAQANREINRQLELRLSKEGVPVEQWRILEVLSDGSGHSMGELADAVLLNHPTLTKMIDRMVSDTLVYRVQDPNDRRKVLMFISDRGNALSKKLNSFAVDQEEHILESYGDKSTSELKRLLESLIDSSN